MFWFCVCARVCLGECVCMCRCVCVCACVCVPSLAHLPHTHSQLPGSCRDLSLQPLASPFTFKGCLSDLPSLKLAHVRGAATTEDHSKKVTMGTRGPQSCSPHRSDAAFNASLPDPTPRAQRAVDKISSWTETMDSSQRQGTWCRNNNRL